MKKEVHEAFYVKYIAHVQTVCTRLSLGGGKGLGTRLEATHGLKLLVIVH